MLVNSIRNFYSLVMSSEQTKKRNRNRYAILRAIQTQGPLKRSEIARLCGIRKTSITGLVEELVQSGVVCSENPERKRSPLVFTQSEWFAVVAAVDNSEVHFARVDLSGKVTDESAEKIADDQYETVEGLLVAGIRKLIGVNPDRVMGVGVSLPGITDSVEGTIKCSINVPQLSGRNIAASFKEKFGVDVIIENDVRASLWAGIWFEHFLASYRDVLYLDIAQGVSSALLMDGRPHAGATFAAGEMGHMQAGDENRACRCGKLDCLEAYCSIDAIKRDIKAVAPQLGELETAVDIADAAADNLVVANILDRAMERLSSVLSVLAAYIDPEVILLGNQDPRFYEVIVPLLKKHLVLRQRGFSSTDVDIQIVPSAGNSALRGAAGLVMDRAFKEKFNS